MKMNDWELLQLLHFRVHSIRMLSRYNPTEFEIDVSYIISKHFSNKCPECKSIAEEMEKEFKSKNEKQK